MDHKPLLPLLLQMFFPLQVQHVINVLHGELHVLVQPADLLFKQAQRLYLQQPRGYYP